MWYYIIKNTVLFQGYIGSPLDQKGIGVAIISHVFDHNATLPAMAVKIFKFYTYIREAKIRLNRADWIAFKYKVI